MGKNGPILRGYYTATHLQPRGGRTVVEVWDMAGIEAI